MKKIIFSIFAVLLITGCTPPKEEIDVAKEEEAIKATIKKELALWWEQDYKAEADLLVKEDYFTAINNNGNFHNITHGYDSIYANIKRYAENENWQYVSNANVEYKDFYIKVYDKVAWAIVYVHSTFDYKGEPRDFENSVRTVFLEKRDDKWLIAMNAITTLNPCKEDDEEGNEED